ncbi:MAG: Ada metal-binding domain-containing protein [bacterium]|nr:Ada metal-binding domain-containing protein [bacterium]
MIQDRVKKVKEWFLPKEDEIILVITIVLVALIGFGLGRLSVSKENKFPIRIQDSIQEANVISSVKTPKAALLVGSKNSRVYHFPWCSGAQRIKEENKIYFSSKEEAEKTGYKPAANCEGL